MGILNFMVEAGEKLFGKTSVDTDKATSILDYINKQALGGIKSLDVKVNADTAVVSGEVEEQSTKEKIIVAAGNVDGISNVEDQIKVVNEGDSGKTSQFYTVKKGDTLSAIAKQFYGDANKYQIIFEANKPMLSDPNKIYPGQNLIIPNL